MSASSQGQVVQREKDTKQGRGGGRDEIAHSTNTESGDDETENEEDLKDDVQNTQDKESYIDKRLRDDLPDEEKKLVAYLCVLAGGNFERDQRFPIRTGMNFVGRSTPECDIFLPTLGVSNMHALIEVSPDGTEHFVEDLGSTNGTTYGASGYRLAPFRLYQLSHDKLLCFEPVKCRYEMVQPLPVGLGEEFPGVDKFTSLEETSAVETTGTQLQENGKDVNTSTERQPSPNTGPPLSLRTSVTSFTPTQMVSLNVAPTQGVLSLVPPTLEVSGDLSPTMNSFNTADNPSGSKARYSELLVDHDADTAPSGAGKTEKASGPLDPQSFLFRLTKDLPDATVAGASDREQFTIAQERKVSAQAHVRLSPQDPDIGEGSDTTEDDGFERTTGSRSTHIHPNKDQDRITHDTSDEDLSHFIGSSPQLLEEGIKENNSAQNTLERNVNDDETEAEDEPLERLAAGSSEQTDTVDEDKNAAQKLGTRGVIGSPDDERRNMSSRESADLNVTERSEDYTNLEDDDGPSESNGAHRSSVTHPGKRRRSIDSSTKSRKKQRPVEVPAEEVRLELAPGSPLLSADALTVQKHNGLEVGTSTLPIRPSRQTSKESADKSQHPGPARKRKVANVSRTTKGDRGKDSPDTSTAIVGHTVSEDGERDSGAGTKKPFRKRTKVEGEHKDRDQLSSEEQEEQLPAKMKSNVKAGLRGADTRRRGNKKIDAQGNPEMLASEDANNVGDARNIVGNRTKEHGPTPVTNMQLDRNEGDLKYGSAEGRKGTTAGSNHDSLVAGATAHKLVNIDPDVCGDNGVNTGTDLSKQGHRIMFTGIPDDDGRRKVVTALGGTVVDTWNECTHLVTDRIRRTVKFLCALSAGRHIVNVKWLDACKKQGSFVGEAKFLLKDMKSEKQYGFSLKTSLNRAQDASQPPLLNGLQVYATPGVQPPRGELREILNAAGAKLIDDIPHGPPSGNVIIIGHPNDAAEVKTLQDIGWRVHSNEIILTGLLRMTIDRNRSEESLHSLK
ncbi:hypothetical protein SpCBS45565_g08149 [Spizellomyces sp. 'palustris']|nr:hypothetical protein SpCBS45565_g08149 [Spizellomyces sp. 'palustris']